MNVTFLEGHRRLSKTFTETSVEAYPQVLKVTSSSHFVPKTVEGLTEKTRLLQEHAKKGHAILKGELTRQLVKESRAGLTDTGALTDNIVIDIDGFVLENAVITAPICREQIRSLAERCIVLLPNVFHDVSYIAHASSSLGLKQNRVSLHLDFALGTSLSPAVVKNWLLHMNLTIPAFINQLDLTTTGMALKYKIDPTLADNSRIIYISHPSFKGRENPIPNDDDRLFLVIKESVAVTVPDSVSLIKKTTIDTLNKDRLKQLREARGLEAKTFHTTTQHIQGKAHTVLTNPDPVKMSYSYERDDWIYYNIDGGDSNAYYVWRDNPQLVFNFKGEPVFSFKAACPTAYQEHIERFVTENPEKFECIPFVFSDKNSDGIYRGFLNEATQTLTEVHKTHRAGVTDWMCTHGGNPPETLQVMDYRFVPTDPRNYDAEAKFINQYKPSRVMSQLPELDEKYKGLTPASCFTAEELCPNIFKLLRSVTGCGEQEIAHWINWFAFVTCRREKTQTAWVLHGTEGTGKGVLFERVIKPILGDEHAVMIRMEQLDEQFNGYMEKAILVMIDEFKFSSSKAAQAMMEKLRNWITEPTITLRNMRENVRSIDSYCSIMMCGNERDMMRPSDEDRRYNIAPRQEKKLFERYPELKDRLELIDAELLNFAAILVHFSYNEAQVKTALANDAKDTMRNAARSNIDDFMMNIRKGSTDTLVDIMDMDDLNSRNEFLSAAKNVVRTILKDYRHDEGVQVFTSELYYLFMAITGSTKQINEREFAKMLSRHGIETGERFRRGNIRGRGTKMFFQDHMLEQLRAEYLVTQPNVVPMQRPVQNEPATREADVQSAQADGGSPAIGPKPNYID